MKGQAGGAKEIVTALETEMVAYDIDDDRHTPPRLRIRAGATVATNEFDALVSRLDRASARVKPGPRSTARLAR